MDLNQHYFEFLESLELKMLQYASDDATIKELNAQMDKEIFEVRERFSDSLSSLQKRKEMLFTDLQVLAIDNDRFLLNGKKSFKTKFGTIGFRVGKPRFVLTGDASWVKITDLLKNSLPSYVRCIYEPCKDRLLTDFDSPQIKMFAPAMGLEITQDESFYVDLKK